MENKTTEFKCFKTSLILQHQTIHLSTCRPPRFGTTCLNTHIFIICSHEDSRLTPTTSCDTMMTYMVLIVSILSIAQGFSPLSKGFSSGMIQGHTTAPKMAGAPLFAGGIATPSSDLAGSLDSQFQILLFEARRCALSEDTSVSQTQTYLSILSKVLNSHACENGASSSRSNKNKEEIAETVVLLRAKVERYSATGSECEGQQRKVQGNRRPRIKKTMPFAFDFRGTGQLSFR